MTKTNFPLESKAIMNILGPQSTKLTITILDSNDSVKLTASITTTSSGKAKYTVDLIGLPSGIYRAAVSATNVQDAVKFSVGLETGSGPISLVTTQENYSPGESILIIGNTGNNARLVVTLYDPSGNVVSETETFSDVSGNFSTENIGIPSDGSLGNWKITAHSRLDTKSIEINVSVPLNLGLTLQIEETEFVTGDIVLIKGVGQSDSNRLTVEIFDEDNQLIVSLKTPITSNGAFSLPWKIPGDISTGVYTINVSDAVNSSSAEIFIQ
jgi:flagellar hook assembly protein FlgD